MASDGLSGGPWAVVRNADGRWSVWPEALPLPGGWSKPGLVGPHKLCIDAIEGIPEARQGLTVGSGIVRVDGRRATAGAFRYGPVLARQLRSATLARIWRAVYGDDLVSGASNFGFTSRQEFEAAAHFLGSRKPRVCLDVGCGTGGLGLFLALALQARLVGIDIAYEAISVARERLSEFPGVSARFLWRAAEYIGLEAGSFDAAWSFDSLWMAQDIEGAIHELERVCRPGARVVVTSWEVHEREYAEIFETQGFRVEAATEPAGWRPRQLQVYAEITRHASELHRELGDEGAEVLLEEARRVPIALSRTPRILLLASKAAD